MWILNMILLQLCELVYPIIPQLYGIIETLAVKDLFAENSEGALIRDRVWTNLYVILSVLVLFAIAIKLINAIVNPDVLTEKQKGAKAMYFKSVVAVFLIVLLPILFSTLRDVQNDIFTDDLISKIIIGESNGLGTAGQTLAIETARSFVQMKEGQTNPFDGSSDISASLKALDENNAYKDPDDQDYVEKFNPLLMLISGIYIVYQLITITLDVAVRTIKLRVLELMVPAIIGGYLFKTEILKTWFKEYIKCFIQVFLLLISVSLISLLLKLLPTVANDDSSGIIIKALLIFGILTLAKQVIPLINTIFGANIKSKGGIKGRLGEMAALGGLAQQAWGALGNKAKGFVGGIAGLGATGLKNLGINAGKLAANKGKGIANGIKQDIKTANRKTASGKKVGISGVMALKARRAGRNIKKGVKPIGDAIKYTKANGFEDAFAHGVSKAWGATKANLPRTLKQAGLRAMISGTALIDAVKAGGFAGGYKAAGSSEFAVMSKGLRENQRKNAKKTEIAEANHIKEDGSYKKREVVVGHDSKGNAITQKVFAKADGTRLDTKEGFAETLNNGVSKLGIISEGEETVKNYARASARQKSAELISSTHDAVKESLRDAVAASSDPDGKRGINAILSGLDNGVIKHSDINEAIKNGSFDSLADLKIDDENVKKATIAALSNPSTAQQIAGMVSLQNGYQEIYGEDISKISLIKKEKAVSAKEVSRYEDDYKTTIESIKDPIKKSAVVEEVSDYVGFATEAIKHTAYEIPAEINVTATPGSGNNGSGSGSTGSGDSGGSNGSNGSGSGNNGSGSGESVDMSGVEELLKSIRDNNRTDIGSITNAITTHDQNMDKSLRNIDETVTKIKPAVDDIKKSVSNIEKNVETPKSDNSNQGDQN